jgi:hypothetical protein
VTRLSIAASISLVLPIAGCAAGGKVMAIGEAPPAGAAAQLVDNDSVRGRIEAAINSALTTKIAERVPIDRIVAETLKTLPAWG